MNRAWGAYVVGAEVRTTDFCRNDLDARAHPYEPSILLRARLPPLSAFESADPALRRADAIVPSVISAWARSHALCDSPGGRSLDRRSREVPLTTWVASVFCTPPCRERALGVPERSECCPERDMGRGPKAKAHRGDSRR